MGSATSAMPAPYAMGAPSPTAASSPPTPFPCGAVAASNAIR